MPDGKPTPGPKPKPVERISPTTGEVVGGSTIATREGVVIAEQRQVQADRRPSAKNPTSTAYGLFQFLDSTWGGVGGRL